MKKNKIVIFLILVLCLFYFPGNSIYASASSKIISDSECQYLKDKGSLKIGIIANWNPFSYITKHGAYQGLPVDILNRLTNETGISLEFVCMENYSESLEQLKAGNVDMITILTEHSNENTYKTEDTNLKIVPYITTQAVLIKHKNTNLNSQSVITMADITGRYAFTHNKNLSTIYYKTPNECLNAVRCGQVDSTICDVFTGATLMQQYEAKDLMSIPANMSIKFGFGLLKGADKRLISALEKVISNISNDDITRSLIEGSNYNSKNFFEFIYRYPFEILCFASAIMFIIALCLITYTKVNVRQHQSLQGYEESYRLLSDTFGEAGMEYDYLNDCLTIFGKHSNLDIDQKVDDFKEKLKSKSIRISLTKEQLAQIINDGAENKSFSTEFQCGVKSGEWIWYRLIYTVICTTESHRRPIRLVGCLANIEAEHIEKEKLMKLSSNDQLTGLLNHKTAEERIRLALDDDTKSRTSMLVIMDIDHFKMFNDEKGHLCGDDVLRSLGQAICEIFSKSDILCRWGGDEFLLFLVDDNNETQNFYNEIKILRKKMSKYKYQDVSCPVTLSIGGAKSYHGCTFDILFQQADETLYLAKNNGRDQFWLYAPTEQKAIEQVEEQNNEV